MTQCHSKLQSLSVFAFRRYSAQTLKLRLFTEAHSHEFWSGFLFLMLEASVHWSTRSETFSPEHSLVLSCAQVFIFGCLIWFSYSLDQTTKSVSDLLFRPFCALIFLMLISVFASMSNSLSSSQYLYILYPIHLLSGFWCWTSAYFYELHFPYGEVSRIQVKLVGSHLAFSCCLQKIAELCFLLPLLFNTAPSFDTIANFWLFHFLPHKLSLSQSTVTWVLCYSIGI